MHLPHQISIIYGILLSLTLIQLLNGVPVDGESSPDEDEYLDELLKEFKETQNKALEDVSESENSIPLNVQKQFLKHDNCNCTRFFMCDVGSKKPKSKEVSEEEEEEEEVEGADLDLINIRLNVPAGGCPHYLDICCSKLKEKPPTVVKTPKLACGKRNDRGVGFRIVGGKDSESNFGEFPWMTALIELKPPKNPDGKVLKAFVCGASLIHPQVVVTAGHCLRNKTASSLLVRVGEWDTQTTNELYPHQEVQVDKIILHPNFVMKRVLLNDIALLVLKSEVQLAPNVSPICLPSATTNMDGQQCLATGWGKDDFGAHGVYHSILKKVDLPVVPTSECQSRLRETKLGGKFHLHESFVCAGGSEKGKDTCKGDGGSPLVCQVPGSSHYVQYGIVSWGIGCGGEIPAVYVNLPHFIPWIEETIETLGLGGHEKYSFSEPR